MEKKCIILKRMKILIIFFQKLLLLTNYSGKFLQSSSGLIFYFISPTFFVLSASVLCTLYHGNEPFAKIIST